MSKTVKVARLAGGMVAGLVLLVLTVLLVAGVKARSRLEQHFDSHRVEIAVPTPLSVEELAALRAERTSATAPAGDAGDVARSTTLDPLAGLDLTALAAQRALARGRHLVEARYACSACHGTNFAGGVMMDELPIATIRGPNITRGKGGLPADYSMADWDRIVRHGIKHDGRPAMMPSEDFFAMTDQELSDIVCYISAHPPIDVEVPKPSFGPVGNVLLALGKFPVSAERVSDHHRAHTRVAPPVADTAEFGAHLAATCSGCHRENLAGGPMLFGPPDWPEAANLTRHPDGLSSWTYDDFDRALTRGISKSGRPLREPMTHVLPGTRAMTAVERKALWTFLATVEPQAKNL